MQIKKNSFWGWFIHVAFAAGMGWLVGYLLIPGTVALLTGLVMPMIVDVILVVAFGVFYLYGYRQRFDTTFPFKNGGWLR